ncbi:MAG: alcohol dehydrogenase catalytic domain-containing protein [Actinomycetota bacterium]
MRYVEIHPGTVALHDGDPPSPAPDEARVRVLACGVCGTDVHALHGMVLPRGATYPVRPGHEVVGIVEELGPQAAEDTELSIGDSVVLHPLIPCGRCPACYRGEDQRCSHVVTLGFELPGGMAEQVCWPASRMVVVNGLPPAEAALLPDAAATAYHALSYADLPPDGVLCVMGAGGIGLNVLKLAQALYPSASLAAVVRREASAERVRRLGAFPVVGLDASHRTVRDAVGPAHAVIDFSGARQAAGEAVRMLSRGGRLILGSVLDEPIMLGTTVTGVTAREISVIGAYVSSLAELEAVAKLALDGEVSLSDAVSKQYPLDEAPAALQMAADRPPGFVRAVLDIGGDGSTEAAPWT